MISNGVLNLALDKRRAIQEIHRVSSQRPAYLADVFLDKDIQGERTAGRTLWAGCVAGALLEEEIVSIACQTSRRTNRGTL